MNSHTDTKASIDLGILKPFKPMRFHDVKLLSIFGFCRHGIWEVTGKRRKPPTNKWYCTIRRIATARSTCPIGEEFEFYEEWLVESMYYDPSALDVFS